MTLQYRIRSKFEDDLWRQRVYLCERLVYEAVDQWFLSGGVFPTQLLVAAVLYLFSPRCYPYELSPYRLVERLGKLSGTSEEEYRQAWPRWSEAEGQALLASLSALVENAVSLWTAGDEDWSSGKLAERLVDEIVAKQYVVFHHTETTRRDVNHWGI